MLDSDGFQNYQFVRQPLEATKFTVKILSLLDSPIILSFIRTSGCRTIQRQTIEEDFPIQRVKDLHSDFLFGGAKRTGAKGVIFSVMHTDISCTTTPSSVCVHVVSHLSTAVSCHNN